LDRVKIACKEAGQDADLSKARDQIENQCDAVAVRARAEKAANCRKRVSLYRMKITTLETRLGAAGSYDKKKQICSKANDDSLRLQAEDACRDAGNGSVESTELIELAQKRQKLCMLKAPLKTSCLDRCSREARKTVSNASTSSKRVCLRSLRHIEDGGRVYEACMACGQRSKVESILRNQRRQLKKRCKKPRVEPPFPTDGGGITVDPGGGSVTVEVPDDPEDDDLFD